MEKFPWLDSMEYPFTSRYFEIDGHRMHYIDEGQGEVILFVHGTPSWSFDWRNVIKHLSQHCRCIAMDHIGFGLSDKPAVYDYSTLLHNLNLEKLTDYLGLKGFTIAVHDFGGPIGLQLAIQRPELVKKIVILNSWMWSSADDPDYIKLKRVLKSPLLPFLYRYLNFSPRYILPQSFGDHKLTSKLRRQYTKPFANPSQRNGALAFAKSLLHDQDWFQGLWEKKATLQEKPVLFIWGMKDRIIRPHHLDKFLTGFPNAEVIRLERSGHFPQEEEPMVVADGIKNFVLPPAF